MKNFTGQGRQENRVVRGQPEYSEEMELGGSLGNKRSFREAGEIEKRAGVERGQIENSGSPQNSKKAW